MKARINEYMFKNADQCAEKNVLMSMPLKHLQGTLRFPAYYWCGDERVYASQDVAVRPQILEEDHTTRIQELISEIMVRWEDQLVLASTC